MSLTPEQLELRRSGYGASEVATIVGVGPGKLVQVYEEKKFGPAPEEEWCYARHLVDLTGDCGQAICRSAKIPNCDSPG